MHSLHSTIHLIKQLVPDHTVQTKLAIIFFYPHPLLKAFIFHPKVPTQVP